MTSNKTGLVIGKFYPYHEGHQYLIRTALSEMGSVVVVVMGSQFESIDLNQRASWIQNDPKLNARTQSGLGKLRVITIPDDAPVGYESDSLWAAHTEIVLAALWKVGAGDIDVLYTSEEYGDRLALALGAEHFCVDKDRVKVPLSGTAVRSNPADNWGKLPRHVRADMGLRIAIVGAESTGTTTLANELTYHYKNNGYPNLSVVPEYGREYTYEKFADLSEIRSIEGQPTTMDDLVWTREDFEKIGNRQKALEDNAVLVSPLTILDTDAFATTIWHDRYIPYNYDSKTYFSRGESKIDLYIITDYDGVPFEDDGWRDGESIREKMTNDFIKNLTDHKLPWMLATGDRATRLANAKAVIDEHIKRKLTFYSPPWATATTF